jgi:hypothetical protein
MGDVTGAGLERVAADFRRHWRPAEDSACNFHRQPGTPVDAYQGALQQLARRDGKPCILDARDLRELHERPKLVADLIAFDPDFGKLSRAMGRNFPAPGSKRIIFLTQLALRLVDPDLAPTGSFDARTSRALKAFQQKAGIADAGASLWRKTFGMLLMRCRSELGELKGQLRHAAEKPFYFYEVTRDYGKDPAKASPELIARRTVIADALKWMGILEYAADMRTASGVARANHALNDTFGPQMVGPGLVRDIIARLESSKI